MTNLAAVSRRLGASLAKPELAAWVIIADDEVDQICGSEREARKEAKDLRDMGCTVKVKAFTSWNAAEDYADKVRGY